MGGRPSQRFRHMERGPEAGEASAGEMRPDCCRVSSPLPAAHMRLKGGQTAFRAGQCRFENPVPGMRNLRQGPSRSCFVPLRFVQTPLCLANVAGGQGARGRRKDIDSCKTTP